MTAERHQRAGSRAFGLGSPRMVAALLAALAILVAGVALFLTRPTSQPSPFAPSRSSVRYGGLPSWLPRARVKVGRLVHASAAHPWLAIEGDTVSVGLRGGSVTATAVGCAVPREGQFPQPRTTPCTFTVTLAATAGVVPLSASAFTIVDEFGQLHHPRVSVRGAGPLPRRLRAGRNVALILTDVLPTGNGRLSWAPAGARPIVSWDFAVEID